MCYQRVLCFFSECFCVHGRSRPPACPARSGRFVSFNKSFSPEAHTVVWKGFGLLFVLRGQVFISEVPRAVLEVRTCGSWTDKLCSVRLGQETSCLLGYRLLAPQWAFGASVLCTEVSPAQCARSAGRSLHRCPVCSFPSTFPMAHLGVMLWKPQPCSLVSPVISFNSCLPQIWLRVRIPPL